MDAHEEKHSKAKCHPCHKKQDEKDGGGHDKSYHRTKAKNVSPQSFHLSGKALHSASLRDKISPTTGSICKLFPSSVSPDSSQMTQPFFTLPNVTASGCRGELYFEMLNRNRVCSWSIRAARSLSGSRSAKII